jgi:hypothetical protein
MPRQTPPNNKQTQNNEGQECRAGQVKGGRWWKGKVNEEGKGK